MQNKETIKLTKPISEIILNQEFDEVKVPFVNARLYKADPVDRFLTQIASEVEHLEKASKRLLQFYENHKNSRLAESNSGPIEDKTVTNDLEMIQVLKSKEQRMERIQKHMTELLENAENKAETIIADAELERQQIIQQAKLEAEKIISEAQKRAAEISRTAEENIKEAQLVKYEMNKRAQEIQSEIVSKADQLDEMRENLAQMSQKLRGLVKEASA